ncbi:helix-turn-helix transcriptional regulator [Ilumatobacter sp.]|uniref:helix-turn-helix transcriptional regulator n=1 Tax=Ilumatobacter sp. TaxID=1967498 RepID=UPI003C678ACB
MGVEAFVAARDELISAQGRAVTGEDACTVIAEAFRRVARHDAAAVMTTDPETHLPAGGIVTGFDPEACVPFWDNELLDPDFNKFNDLARSIDPVATLAEATDDDLDRSPRYQKLYAAAEVSDECRVVFMSGSSCLAIAAFVRCDDTAYTPTEISDVRNLLPPATHLLRSAMVHVGEPLSEGGPVVVLLDASGGVISRSLGADTVLDDLRVEIDGEIPGTVLVAAARARARKEPTRLTTRLRGTSGRWVRMHVAPMDGNDGTVSVTIDAAAPGDLVPILLDSYGLSEREVEIVLQLCRGIGTKEIAVELMISVHTVRDHLKSIFEKAGVNSRGELVARMFSGHLLHPFHDRVVHVRAVGAVS